MLLSTVNKIIPDLCNFYMRLLHSSFTNDWPLLASTICAEYVPFVDSSAARLVTALVLSRLDYCNAMLAGLPASTLAPFQRVLHAEARTVLDLEPRDRVTPALRELHWLPVTERIQYKLCLLAHKSLLEHTPQHLRPSYTRCRISGSIHTTCLITW